MTEFKAIMLEDGQWTIEQWDMSDKVKLDIVIPNEKLANNFCDLLKVIWDQSFDEGYGCGANTCY